jgi:hypothetical protein
MAMASVKLICKKCGNEFTWRRNCYNRRDADNSESWARENVTLCPECAAEVRREAEAAKQAEAVKGLSVELPENLTGSEKQIAWAKDIREKYALMIQREYVNEADDDLRVYYVKVLDVIIAENPSAKWWIDHRDELKDITSGGQMYVDRMDKWVAEYQVSDPEGYAKMMEIANS